MAVTPTPAPEVKARTDETLRPVSEPAVMVTPTDTAKLPQSERYEIQSVIGSGGMGKVYKAFDRKLKRNVALKFLRGADAELERRFLQEAQAQARVDHPGVCKVYEVGRIGEEPYIAMQLIEGETLRDAARNLSVPQKLALLQDVAEAVHAAHKIGLVHRDLKPANILIEAASDGLRAFITDFGLARDTREPGESIQGALLGTPQYMAPEQAKGDHQKIDARTDIYGLGATMYEVLTGKPPFEGGTHLQTLYKMMHEDPLPPRRHAPSLPPEVEGIVLKCLEKDPQRRYETARSLANDIGAALRGEPVTARPPGAAGRLWRKIKRHKAVTAALAAVALALIVPRVWALFTGSAPVMVAVADFDNQTGDDGLDGLSGMLITSLEQSRKLSVLTRSRMFDLARQQGHPDAAKIDEPLGREIARQAGSRALLLAAIRRFDNLYSIDLKILDPRTNVYIGGVQESGQGKASIPPMIDKLSEGARRILRDSAGDKRPPVEDVTTRDLTAYQHFFRGEEAIDHLQFAKAAEEMRAALRIDKDFALAWYGLAYAEMWMHDGPRGREAIDRALALADKLPEKERLLAHGVSGSLHSKGQEAYDAYKECADRWPSEKECQFMLGDVVFHGGYVSYSLPK
ncbi:MAG: protein kinase, partial [Myxococcales bacterium]|nr:protein kinase [Myxococcales bacterium]